MKSAGDVVKARGDVDPVIVVGRSIGVGVLSAVGRRLTARQEGSEGEADPHSAETYGAVDHGQHDSRALPDRKEPLRAPDAVLWDPGVAGSARTPTAADGRPPAGGARRMYHKAPRCSWIERKVTHACVTSPASGRPEGGAQRRRRSRAAAQPRTRRTDAHPAARRPGGDAPFQYLPFTMARMERGSCR